MSQRILAIDPGVTTGVAFFVGTDLKWSGKAVSYAKKNREAKFYEKFGTLIVNQWELIARIDAVVYEAYQSYGKPGKAPQRTANVNGKFCGMALAAALGLYHCDDVVEIGNAAWTGGVKKEVRHLYTRQKFGIEGDMDHNELDAIGLGDWYAGQL